MYIRKAEGPRQVTLPDGSVLSLADLPPADIRRWVASRKAVMARAVRYGLISEADARERYSLSEEELTLWCQAIESWGEKALKVTSLQKYRQL